MCEWADNGVLVFRSMRDEYVVVTLIVIAAGRSFGQILLAIARNCGVLCWIGGSGRNAAAGMTRTDERAVPQLHIDCDMPLPRIWDLKPYW